MIYETNLKIYYRLKECLSEIYPQVEVKLISADQMLQKLGFVDEVPCQVEVCASQSQLEEIRDMANDFEICAYNTPDGNYPNEDDENYKQYLRYGWLYDFL